MLQSVSSKQNLGCNVVRRYHATRLSIPNGPASYYPACTIAVRQIHFRIDVRSVSKA